MLALSRKVIYGVVAALGLTAVSMALVNSTQSAGGYIGVTREFYLANMELEGINETALKIPPDQFSQTQITVHKGDTVVIHFYNLEKEKGDHHSFTIADGPYKMNYELDAGEQVDIKFVAEHRGIWEYLCTFHKPTMRGELVVL